MKYYKICRKLLGNAIFEKLVSRLVKKLEKNLVKKYQ